MPYDLAAFAAAIAGGDSSGSGRTSVIYRAGAALFLEMLGGDLKAIRSKSLRDFRDFMAAHGLAPATMRTHMAGTKRFLRFLREDGVALPEMHAPDLPTVKAKAPPILTDRDIGEYFGYIARHVPQPAAGCMMLIPLTGLRLNEACGIRVEQLAWDQDDGLFVVRNVRGKSKSHRNVRLLATATGFLKSYLGARRGLRQWSATNPWLFPNTKGGHISSKDIENRVKATTRALGLHGVTPHTLRHYWATKADAAGVPLVVIQTHLGHESIATTRRYIHVTDNRMREGLAAMTMPVPKETA